MTYAGTSARLGSGEQGKDLLQRVSVNHGIPMTMDPPPAVIVTREEFGDAQVPTLRVRPVGELDRCPLDHHRPCDPPGGASVDEFDGP